VSKNKQSEIFYHPNHRSLLRSYLSAHLMVKILMKKQTLEKI